MSRSNTDAYGRQEDNLVEITLLDGNVCYPGGKKNAIKVRDIITFAHTKSGINGKLEAKFFSLYTYEECGEEPAFKDYPGKQRVFLDERKSSRMLIDHFYSKERKKTTWHLHYGVKYYIPQKEIVKQLQDKEARKLYYLQLCKDIHENNLILHYPLDGIEHSTSNPEEDKTVCEGLVSGKKEEVSPEVVTKFLKCISECADDAILHYGKHFFLARTADDERELVTIASWFDGMTIYYEKKEAVVLLWNDIIKISYQKNIFTIKYREIKCHERAPSKVRYTTYDEVFHRERPQAKWIWKSIVEQHSFRFGQFEKLSVELVVFTRRTWFRSGRTMKVKEKGKYVIEKKDRETWKIVSSPRSDMDLNQTEDVQTDVIIADNFPEVEFHFEIIQESTGVHKLFSYQTDQVIEVIATSEIPE